MSQWMEMKRAYPNERSIAKIREVLAKGPRPIHEVENCCAGCREALKWMRQHGMAERLMGGRVRLYRQASTG